MENFTNNPGLQHLAETIFLNVEVEHLSNCQNINQASYQILDLGNPNFWLKKWKIRGLSKKNHDDWKKAIQLTKNTPFEVNISFYMKKVLKNKAGIDIQCYVDKNSIQKLIDRTMSFGLNEAFEHNIQGRHSNQCHSAMAQVDFLVSKSRNIIIS